MRIVSHTICKDEDRFIGATLSAWAPYCEKMMVWDTGSTDSTIDMLDNMASLDLRIRVRYLGPMTVDSAMGIRDRQIQATRKAEDLWILILDADEIWHPEEIEKALVALRNPEIDHLGVRPISIGEDPRTCYNPYYFQPPDPWDLHHPQRKTMYWCDKYTLRFHRSTRLLGVRNAKWGLETFVVKKDPVRHKDAPTNDFVDRGLPQNILESQYTGRCKWTDIGYFHTSLIRRSSKRPPRRGYQPRCPIPAHYETPPQLLQALAL